MTRLPIRLRTVLLLVVLLASDAARAANGTPLWVLEQNRRAAEQAERRPTAPLVSRPAATPTVAVPTPRQLDPG
jgi:hypothetical protein